MKLQKGENCAKGAQFKQWAMRYFNIVTIGSTAYMYSQIDKNDPNSNCQMAKKEELFESSKGKHCFIDVAFLELEIVCTISNISN